MTTGPFPQPQRQTPQAQDAPCAYDRLDLIVWSGTGNTRAVAERLATLARAQGAQADVHPRAAAVPTESTGRRLLGLLAPTHGFTAPWPLLKLALTLPGVRGKDVFVLVTRGAVAQGDRLTPGFEGTAAYLPAAILALRGAHVRGVGAVDMPLNWMVLVPGFPPDRVAALVAMGAAQTDAFAAPLLRGERVLRGQKELALGLLMLPLALGYMLVARLLMAKMFFADERCTACGLCAQRCPQGAIRMRGEPRRPYWTYDCQNCMRCMAHCPTEAIQSGQGWLLLYGALIGLPVAATLAALLRDRLGITATWASVVLNLVLGYLWIVVVVWLGYLVLWWGLRVPGVRTLLARLTFTRRYRRYRGPTL